MRKIILLLMTYLIGGALVAQNYTFNHKITIKMVLEGEAMQTYYYLNTQTGTVGQDRKAFQMAMPNEPVEGLDFFIVEYDKSTHHYVTVEGTKYKMSVPLSGQNYTATQFWKEFKKTGKIQTFGKYEAEEYSGTLEDGTTANIWLSTAPVSDVRGQLKGDIAGLYGTGYLYKPTSNQYFRVIHFISEEGNVTFLNAEAANVSFNPVGYQPMSMTSGMPNPRNMPDNGEGDFDEVSSLEEIEGMGSSGGVLESFSYSSIFEQATNAFEISLPMLKQQANNTQIPAEQRAELQKQITCVEKTLPLYKRAATEMKQAEQRYAGNTDKLNQEFERLSRMIEEGKSQFCDEN